MNFNTTAINDSITQYFALADKGDSIVTTLKAAFHIGTPKAATKAEVKLSVNRMAALRYGVTVNAKNNLPNGTAAYKKAERLVNEILSDTTVKQSIDVPPHIAKLAAALWTACAEYEQAAKIAATALANAKVK